MSQRLDEGLEGRTAPRTVTKADIVLFGGQTGDYSAMHFDHNAALARDDGRIIAHGLLGAAFSLGSLAQSRGPKLLVDHAFNLDLAGV